jgi:hypothetical protein
MHLPHDKPLAHPRLESTDFTVIPELRAPAGGSPVAGEALSAAATRSPAESPAWSAAHQFLLDAIRAGLGRMREEFRVEANFTLHSAEIGPLHIRIVEAGTGLRVAIEVDHLSRWTAQAEMKQHLERSLGTLGYSEVSVNVDSRDPSGRRSGESEAPDEALDADRVKLPAHDPEGKN